MAKTAIRRYRSRAARVLHRTVESAHKAGVVDKKTMREFDELCLTAAETFTAARIRKLRTKENVSQAVFARHLGVTTGLVSQWERGEKKPGPMARKVLSVVEKKGLSIMA